MNQFGFDPQRAFEAAKKLAADAPAHVADGVGRLVRDAPAERLEQVMRSPARKPILDGIFWQMPRQLDVSEAAGLKATIRWCITGRPDGEPDVYVLEIDDGRCYVVRSGAGTDPRLTITLDGPDFIRLVSGNLDPMKAYFKGRIKLSGDIMVAAKLATLFRMPGGGATSGGNDGNGGNGRHG